MWLKLFLWWQYYSSMYNSTLFLVWRIRESGQQKSPFVGNGKSGRNSQLDDRTLIFLFLSSFLTVPWKNFFFWILFTILGIFFSLKNTKFPLTQILWVILILFGFSFSIDFSSFWVFYMLIKYALMQAECLQYIIICTVVTVKVSIAA